MLWKNRFSQSIQLAVTLILVGIELASPPLVMSNSSEESDRQNNSPSDQTTLNFQPPNRGAPGTRADAGSRGGSGQCSKLEKPITALIPTTNWGETIAAHPTFPLTLNGTRMRRDPARLHFASTNAPH